MNTFLGNLILISLAMISLPAFPSRTNPDLQNIHITPQLIKKVTTSLDSPNASDPDEEL